MEDLQFHALGEPDACHSFRWIEEDMIEMALVVTGIAREISYGDDEPLEQLFLGARHSVD